MRETRSSAPGQGNASSDQHADILATALDLHVTGRSVQALRALSLLGPLESIGTTEGRLIAGRIASSTGGSRLGEVLHLTAWRRDRSHPEARYYYAFNRYARRGPLVALRFMHTQPLLEAPTKVKADWAALEARILADFRDFESAEARMAHALDLEPGSDWLMGERSEILRKADRVNEARDYLEHAWQLNAPRSRIVLWALAILRNDMDDRSGALDLLRAGLESVESGGLWQFRASVEMEMGEFDSAATSLAKARDSLPLLDRRSAASLNAQEADLALRRRDFARLSSLAAADKKSLASHLHERINGATSEARRVRLPVRRIRQDYATCSPASFCALTSFWNRPVDHQLLSKEISYDGTPGHRERHWAETHGWSVREFRVTWDSARLLLDAGLPFTLVTADEENAHEQVVVGYDDAVRTLLISDPSSAFTTSIEIDALVEDQEIVGPRALVIVPKEDSARIEGLSLPDSELYDLRYAVDRALFVNDRNAGEDAFARIETRAPDSIHRHWAKRQLALFDQNEAALAEVAERLFQRFESAGSAIGAKLHSLQWAGRLAEALELLKAVADGPAGHVGFLHTYAEAARADSREAPKVASLVNRSLRLRPTHPPSLRLQAELDWERGDRETAMTLFRLASTSAEASEENASAYFRAAQRMGRGDQGLAFLRARFERARGRSTAPFQTLFWHMCELDRSTDAFAEMDRELAITTDSEFRCWAAEVFGRFGMFERANALLQATREKVRPAFWERTQAELSSYEGDLHKALRSWERIVELEPLAVDGHSSIARLTAAIGSPEAGLAYTEGVAARFPYHVGLARLRYQWADVAQVRTEEALGALRRLCMGDAWVRREMAQFLGQCGRVAEGLAELRESESLDCLSASHHAVKGQLLLLAGRIDEAEASFKESIRADVSNVGALTGLMNATPMPRASGAIRFVLGELKTQPRWSDALSNLYPSLVDHFSPSGVQTELDSLAALCRDNFEAAFVRIDHLLSRGLAEQALEASQVAGERFQDLPGLMLREAEALAQMGRSSEERDAVERALAAAPRWPIAIQRYAQVLLQDSREDEAVRRLETGIAQNPFTMSLRVQLADIFWGAQKKQEALATVERAIVVDATSQAAWGRYIEWSEELHRRDHALQSLRALCGERPGSVDLWLLVATTLQRPEDLDERLRALDRAITIDPRRIESHDLKSMLLAQAGDFESALAACRHAAWKDRPPLELRGRRAWVHAMRGEMPSAIREMTAVVEEAPGYRFGLDRLLEWLEGTEQFERYARFAAQFTEVAPREPTAWGHRGSAALALGQFDEAIAHFERAVALSPGYTFAVRNLADQYWKKARTRDALKILEAAPNGRHESALLRQRMQILSGEGDNEGLKQTLVDWLKLPEIVAADLEAVLSQLTAAGKDSLIEAAFSSAGLDLTARAAGQALIGEALRRSDIRTARARISLLEGRPEPRLGGLYQMLVDPSGPNGIRMLIFRHQYRKELKQSTLLWAALGNNLLRGGWRREAVRALRDWRKRFDAGEVEPWMLSNLAEALIGLGRTHSALLVSRAALALPHDHTSGIHTARLAAHGCFERPPAETRRLIHSAQRQQDPGPRNRMRLEIASAVIEGREPLPLATLAQGLGGVGDDAETHYLWGRAVWKRERSSLLRALAAVSRVNLAVALGYALEAWWDGRRFGRVPGI
jgi:tetratricopeptide (TPR) repeat protein